MKKIMRFVRTHLAASIAAATVAVVLIGGVVTLTLIGTGGSPGPAAAITAPTTSTTAAPPAAHGKGAKGAKGVKGQVTAINGTTWTVALAKGTTVTVNVTATTAFGTNAMPLAPSAFHVGDQVVVMGTRTKDTVTATRIAMSPTPAPTPATAPAQP